MDLFKKKAGGCSSMSYSGVSDNYMLSTNALVNTGGANKTRKNKGGNDDNFLNGGALRRRGGNSSKDKYDELFSGGNPENDEMFGGAKRKAKGKAKVNHKRKANPKRHGGAEGETPTPSASMFGFGSAMKGITDSLSSLTKTEGGCGSLKCKKNDMKKGGTGVELAPFISSLVLLGLRAANDKALQMGITKKLGSLVSTRKSKKSKTKSRKSTTVAD